MLEDISAEILSVSTADGMAEIGSKEQRTKFPVFPDEKPSATQLKQWLDCWTDDLNASGYAALLRGEETFELKKLKPRPLISVDGITDEAKLALIAEKNANIKHQNDINKEEKDARVLELQTRLTSLLQRSLRDKAPVLLKSLEKAHPMIDSDGDAIEGAYNGADIFNDLKVNKIKVTSDYDKDKITNIYDRMKHQKAADNCEPGVYAKRINLFNVHVNPHLDPPLSAERHAKFVINQLPAALAADGQPA